MSQVIYKLIITAVLFLSTASINAAYHAIQKEMLYKKSGYAYGQYSNRLRTRSIYINDSVSRLKKDYEFIIFYEADCKYCIAFALILKQYSVNTGIRIIGFMLGSIPDASPLFTDTSQVDQKTISQFFGEGARLSTPTLFIWNKNNGHVYPVVSGLHSYEELTDRMNELAPRIIQNERKLTNMK